jgi:hypothetical protein
MRTLLLSAALLLGCSSKAEDAVPFETGLTLGADAAAPVDQLRLAYPPPPYGAAKGSVLPNYRFLGWSNPKSAGYDTAHLESLSLADFYDPKGEKGIRYIVLTSTAVWCSACKQEYVDMVASGGAYQNKGVRFFGALFQDANSNPAQPGDLKKWASTYKVPFAMGLDPEFKLGGAFDVEATPMEMVLDARTMEILDIESGWIGKGTGSLWEYLDTLLAR